MVEQFWMTCWNLIDNFLVLECFLFSLILKYDYMMLIASQLKYSRILRNKWQITTEISVRLKRTDTTVNLLNYQKYNDRSTRVI